MAIETATRLCVVFALLLQSAAVLPQAKELPAAKPIDPIDGILEAFKSNSIVALSDGAHRNLQFHEFRLRLIRDPRFADAVNDIVVESGNALYQDAIDRFVGGEQVPYSELRKVWEDTTQASGVWDVPIYEEFFRAVRAVNAALPKQKQLRVLLADPPVDWSRVKSAADLEPFLSQRDEYPVALIRREVLAKHRRALVVYGNIHFLRRSLYFQLPDPQDAETTGRKPVDSIVSLLEGDGSTRIFSIYTSLNLASWRALQSEDIGEWPVPSLTRVANTELGAQPFVALRPGVRMFRPVDGALRGFDPDPVRSHRIQDQFDAVLFLATRDQQQFSQRSPQLCNDANYVEMRLTRIRTTAGAGPIDSSAWFKRECPPHTQ